MFIIKARTLWSDNILPWPGDLVTEYEIVLPEVFHINLADIPDHRRSRRSVSSNIFINISTKLDVYQIKLIPNNDLLGPGFKIYHRHGENSTHMAYNVNTTDSDDISTQHDDIITKTDDITDEVSKCHYKGEVTSHDNAPAAFSLCGGLD
ncbi:hypothetical protein ACF0H5_007100 [Mactra antiquata]